MYHSRPNASAFWIRTEEFLNAAARRSVEIFRGIDVGKTRRNVRAIHACRGMALKPALDAACPGCQVGIDVGCDAATHQQMQVLSLLSVVCRGHRRVRRLQRARKSLNQSCVELRRIARADERVLGVASFQAGCDACQGTVVAQFVLHYDAVTRIRLQIAVGADQHTGHRAVQRVYEVRDDRQPLIVQQWFVPTAHAAAMPEAGINALKAVIHLFTGIDALRQHLREDVRIHGIISDGGRAPNVVPDFAAANFMLRCRDRDYLQEVVVDKVRQVAEGAALISGAQLEVSPFYPFYENVLPNSSLAIAVRSNAAMLDLQLDEPLPGRRGSGASTDFGNVSQVKPAFELRYAVSDEAVPSHSTAMCETAATESAISRAIAIAKLLAVTAGDLLLEPDLLAEARADFERRSTTTAGRVS